MSAYTYDPAFFEHTNRTSLASARRIVSVVQPLLRATSVLDVGCAQGVWLRAWREAGVDDIAGLDGEYVDRTRLLIDPERFTSHDLSAPFDLSRRFDLVQSLEVAEHLPASRAEGFVDDLARHASAVLFSAAPPGQGGENHINERPYEYWRDLFAARGYTLYDCVRPLVRDDVAVAVWYRHNTFLFLDEEAEARLDTFARLFRVVPGAPIADVSPTFYRARKALVRRLPYWACQLLARARARSAAG